MTFSFRNNFLIKTTFEVYQILNKRQRRNALLLILLTFFASILDVLGLASILPVIYTISDNSVIQKNIYLKYLYEYLNFSDTNHFIFFIMFVLLIIFLIKNGIAYLINYYQNRYSYNVATNLSEKQFLTYLYKDLDFIKKNNPATLIANTSSIPVFFSYGILLPILYIFSDFFIIIIIVCFIAVYNINLLLLVSSILGICFYIIYQSTQKKLSMMANQKKLTYPLAFHHVEEAINGYVDIKIASKENFFLQKYIRNQNKINDAYLRSSVITIIPSKSAEIIAILGIIIISCYTIFILDNPKILITLIMFFSISIYRIMPSATRALSSFMTIKSHHYCLDTLKELINFKYPDFSSLTKIPFLKKIELRNLSFRHNDSERWILKNISLCIEKGQRIGIVGESGAGKTTLINLLLRFLTENEGGIWVDDIKISNGNMQSWRAIVGYVKQDAFIMNGTLKSNIVFDEKFENKNDEKILKCINQANLDNFLSTLDNGINSSIGELGSKLSGGEKQRISIARALYQDAEVFICDEPTSNLDPITEKGILETIESLSKSGKTIIIITHKKSILNGCDKIYQLRNGILENQPIN